MAKKRINVIVSMLFSILISLAGCGSKETEKPIKSSGTPEIVKTEDINVEIGYEMIGTASLVIPETKEDLEMFIQK